MAEACIFAAKNQEVRGLVNVGTGVDITISDLAILIKNIISFKGEIEFDLNKPDGTPRKVLDVSKINALGWKAKTSLEDGVKKVYEWYLNK